jgi:hypothetical protein
MYHFAITPDEALQRAFQTLMELLHAYMVGAASAPAPQPSATSSAAAPAPAMQQVAKNDCNGSRTHPYVGYQGDLTTMDHGVTPRFHP